MSLRFLLSSTTQCLILCLISVGFSAANQGSNELTSEEVSSLRSKRDVETTSYFYYQQAEYPRDCQEVNDQCSNTTDGIYFIKPDGYPEPFEVFCNNTIDHGGWTVFQRRKYGDVYFHRTWDDYKNGFGFIHRDFWLGNEKLAHLTNQKDYELRVDLVSSSGESRYAKYNLFRISDEATKYKLVGLGGYNGDSGYDSMSRSSGYMFSTHDQDNDGSSSQCATKHRGGWWYVNRDNYNHCFSWTYNNSPYHCSDSNLNGNFGETGAGSIFWYNLPGSYCNVRYTEMKIRPVQRD